MRECFHSGGSNEAVSYVKDLLQFRPDSVSLLDEVAMMLEEQKCWEHAGRVLEKLTALTKAEEDKSLQYLLRRIRADAERGESNAATIGLRYYNKHCKESQKNAELVRDIQRKLNGDDSKLQNAMAIAEQRMEIPPPPTSLYNLTFTLQSIKNSSAVIEKYLMAIPPERFGELFKTESVDCEPYDKVIGCLRDILEFRSLRGFTRRHNISHCYWAMDVLQNMKSSSQFPFIKALLPETAVASTFRRELIT